MALSIWAILNAAVYNDADTRERILVYGDDVIVPTAIAADAIEELQWYGLEINRAKSCIGGLFRESCGMDAYSGINVTPVRFRTDLSSKPSPDHYCSLIGTANQFYNNGWYETYEAIVGLLERSYGPIPDNEMNISSVPCLIEPSALSRKHRRRWNKALQKAEFYVRAVQPRRVRQTIDGWSMLLRYFTESNDQLDDSQSLPTSKLQTHTPGLSQIISDPVRRLAVSEYTGRRTNKFVFRWR
jgi:hypothetical protein